MVYEAAHDCGIEINERAPGMLRDGERFSDYLLPQFSKKKLKGKRW